MNGNDDFRQELADAGVKMFQKPSHKEFQTMAKELEKLKAQKYSLDELISMAKELETLKAQNPNAPKKFTLKHTFTNISKMDKGEGKSGPMEYHFNVAWYLKIENRNDELIVWLNCARKSKIRWSVQCAYQIQIVHPSGKTKSHESENVFVWNSQLMSLYLMDWEEMKEKYLVGDQLTVVVNVVINEIIGICSDFF